MKKIVVLMLAFAMVFGLIACGGTSAPATGTESNSSEQAAGSGSEGSENAAEPETEKIAEEIPDVTYSVSVADPDGNPVPGVTVEFCDDVACRTEDTDESGTAAFTAKKGSYTVHVLNVPEGFIGTEEEFIVSETGSDIDVTLEILQPVLNEPIYGFSYYNPERYEQIQDKLSWSTYGEGSDVYELHLNYKPESGNRLTLFVLLVPTWDPAVAEETFSKEFGKMIEEDAIIFEKVGSAEGTSCFLYQQKNSREVIHQGFEEMKLSEEAYEEFVALYEDKETFVSGIKMYEPKGMNFLFETQDMDGNAVNMADVLAGHKVTMINCWATWCNPCVKELPQLQKLNKKFEEKGCQIIGICTDLDMNDDTSEAVKILTKAGADFLNMVAPDDTHNYYMLYCWPTSFFVDSEGKMLTDPVFGANVKGYSKALEKALQALEG